MPDLVEYLKITPKSNGDPWSQIELNKAVLKVSHKLKDGIIFELSRDWKSRRDVDKVLVEALMVVPWQRSDRDFQVIFDGFGPRTMFEYGFALVKAAHSQPTFYEDLFEISQEFWTHPVFHRFLAALNLYGVCDIDEVFPVDV